MKIILDTDFGNDIDDVFALAMLAYYQDLDLIDVIAVLNSKQHSGAAQFLAWMCAFLSLRCPVGDCQNGVPQDKAYYLALYDLFKSEYPSVNPLEPTMSDTVLREVLSDVDDNGCTLLMIGNATNIANALKQPELLALMHKKIDTIVWMAGAFDTAMAENNIRVDKNASHALMALWQKDIHFVPFEVGAAIKFPGHRFVECDSDEPQNSTVHPIVQCYMNYVKKPHWGREVWDPVTLLYCLKDVLSIDIFNTKRGGVEIDENEVATLFTGADFQNHVVVSAIDTQEKRAEALQEITRAVFGVIQQSQ